MKPRRQMPANFQDSKEFWAALSTKYDSAAKIRDATGMPIKQILKYLESHGLPSSQKAVKMAVLRAVSDEQIVAKYLETNSLAQTADFFGTHVPSISKRVPKKLRQANQQISHTLRHDFFDFDTEESFYWAGFLMADGCVHKTTSGGDGLRLELSAKDESHLMAFKEAIEFSGEPSKRTKMYKEPQYKPSELIAMHVVSTQLVEGLRRFGIVPRKSLIATMPDWLAQHQLIRHFIRGLFDGDGHVGLTKPKSKHGNSSPHMGLVGSEAIVSTAQEIFERNGLVEPGSKIRPHKKAFVFSYTGSHNCARIRDFMYKDATIFLQRKRDIFYSEAAGPHPLTGRRQPPEYIAAKSKPIEATNVKTGEKTLALSMRALLRDHDFSEHSVYRVLSGKQKSPHKGYTFRRLPTGSLNPDLTLRTPPIAAAA